MLKVSYTRVCSDARLTLLSLPDTGVLEAAERTAASLVDGWCVQDSDGFTVSSANKVVRLPLDMRETETSCFARSLAAIAKLVAAVNRRKNVSDTGPESGIIC